MVQADNAALMRFDLQPGDIPYTHAFVPRDQLDAVVANGNWLFLRSGGGYAALWSAAPSVCQDAGLYKGYEWRVPAEASAWAVALGDADLDRSFEDFQAHWLAHPPYWDDGRLVWQVADGPLRLDPPGTAPPALAVLPTVPQVFVSGVPVALPQM